MATDKSLYTALYNEWIYANILLKMSMAVLSL